MEKTLGGDRLGSGKKMKVELHNYERSTHDLGFIFRTTMSAGTLVPFMKYLVLPGDTMDINLNCDVKTHPTVGPLFGSFKVQLDVFFCPLRLYQGKLHNNKLGIGMNMASVKFPTITLSAPVQSTPAADIDNSQINPSSILAYLGIRGVGMSEIPDATRDFNAIPWISYWDIYKNYYSNKQEDIGYVVHTPTPAQAGTISGITIDGTTLPKVPPGTPTPVLWGSLETMEITYTVQKPNINTIMVVKQFNQEAVNLSTIAQEVSDVGGVLTLELIDNIGDSTFYLSWDYLNANQPAGLPIELTEFNLTLIDDMREYLLTNTTDPNAVSINDFNGDPYELILDGSQQSLLNSQEGLAIKTYQSDVNNNWLKTEYIDGAGGINEITAVDTSTGSFEIQQLILARKVYDMLNRIAVSGGTYKDWIDAVYVQEGNWQAETPVYMGGLSKELVFQEVVSNSESESGQPLGTLAGKGVMGKKHKGGQIRVKVDEPGYVIGIVSLTPRIDYSQGNDWDIHLQTMDDLKKPALDQIGFQELIVERLAWWATEWDGTEWVTYSAGKQPAWIEYMTAVNKCFGNFAVEDNEMFMTLNRRYEKTVGNSEIADLTTYIDPRKYNQIFADTSLDSQNFWVQIGIDNTARRKMSAKIMPNL